MVWPRLSCCGHCGNVASCHPQDEPTNYLDRDSLGALADSIKVFEGGVVMISHNNGALTALVSCQSGGVF